MLKSEKVADQFSSVVRLLELADGEMQSIRELDARVCEDLAMKLSNLIEEVEDAMHETCAPLEMEEDEKLAKIEKMEQELFELRASLR